MTQVEVQNERVAQCLRSWDRSGVKAIAVSPDAWVVHVPKYCGVDNLYFVYSGTDFPGATISAKANGAWVRNYRQLEQAMTTYMFVLAKQGLCHVE